MIQVPLFSFRIVAFTIWTGLCMDDVVERVAQHGLADVLWIYSIVHAVTSLFQNLCHVVERAVLDLGVDLTEIGAHDAEGDEDKAAHQPDAEDQ